MKKLRSISFLLVFLFSGLSASAQYSAPDTLWERSLGGSQYDQAYGICQTIDGSYVVANMSYSNMDGLVGSNHGNGDVWIVKLDSAGNLLWQRCYGGTDLDYPNAIVSSPDGGVVFAGASKSSDGDLPGAGYGDADAWIVKLDDTGAIQWQRRLGGFVIDMANGLDVTRDSGYIVAGITQSDDGTFTGASGNQDIFVSKLAKDGTIQWVKTYAEGSFLSASKIRSTTDGGYMIGGDFSSDSGVLKILLMKLDDTGGIVWQRTYGGDQSTGISDVMQTPDKGYIALSFSSDSGGDVSKNYGMTDYWCLKLDSMGNKQWSNVYGGSWSDNPSSIVVSKRGGYILCGHTGSTDSGIVSLGDFDYWLLRIDDTGKVIWQETLGGPGLELNTCMIEARDTSILLGGITEMEGGEIQKYYGNDDGWVVRVKDAKTNGVRTPKNTDNVKVYPTVSRGVLYAEIPPNAGAVQLSLINALGEVIPVKYHKQNEKYTLYLEHIPAGAYLLQVNSNNMRGVYKILYKPN